MLLSSFFLFIHCWACSLPLGMICFSTETPLGEAKFLFARGSQIEIASGLGMAACAQFSFQLKAPQIWCRSVQALHMVPRSL